MARPPGTFALPLLALLACATAPPPRPRPPPAPACPEDGTTAFGDFLACHCDGNDPVACDLLSMLLEKEGGPERLARAEALRQKACALGYRPSCQRVPPAAR